MRRAWLYRQFFSLVFLALAGMAGGGVWLPPRNFNANADGDRVDALDINGFMATDGNGVWVATWECPYSYGDEYDILFRRSTDDGWTWSPARPLNADAETDAHQDTQCVLATDARGRWVAVWLGSAVAGSDIDLLTARSSDNGRTWSAPALLNSDAHDDTGNAVLPRVATNRDGNFLVVYTDIIPSEPQGHMRQYVKCVRSTDNGATWKPVQVVDDTALGSLPPAGMLSTSVATDCSGRWVIVTDANIDSSGTIVAGRNVFAYVSRTAGRTWSPRIPVQVDPPDADMGDGYPFVVSTGEGRFLVAWHRSTTGVTGTRIVASHSLRGGLKWLPPEDISPADGHRDNTVFLARSNRGTLMAAWASDRLAGPGLPDEADAYFSVSADNGRTWSKPAPLNTNAASDTRMDGRPHITPGPRGSWLALWSHYNIGIDYNHSDMDLYWSVWQPGRVAKDSQRQWREGIRRMKRCRSNPRHW